MHKEYLGDGVYAEVVKGMIMISTERGPGYPQFIYIEPETLEALNRYHERMKEVYAAQQRAYDHNQATIKP